MLEQTMKRYPSLKGIKSEIEETVELFVNGFKSGQKLLICGNGGSSSDSEHIVGELMKGFLLKRPISEDKKTEMKKNCLFINDDYLEKLQCAVPVISLSSFTALNTAFCNDVDPKLIFAQPIMGLGKENDMLLCISTSGNSQNVVAAAIVAKALGLKTVGLTGKTGGQLKNICDVCICVPETETYRIQELHLPVYHLLCSEIEKILFNNDIKQGENMHSGNFGISVKMC